MIKFNKNKGEWLLMTFRKKELVDDHARLMDLLAMTNHIDIELLSETEEEALEKIKPFSNYGDYSKHEVGDSKWFQINSENQKLNVFSYYEKCKRWG